MFDLPTHDAQIVVKSFVCRAARTCQPSAYRRLLIEAGRVSLDSKEPNQILIELNAECPRRFERLP